MITSKDLERFGLSEKEAKVYFASLELGPATATKIAEKAGVNRATTYVEIESLMKMGLVSTFEKNKTTLFAAQNPAILKRILLRREERLKASALSLENLLPELLNMYEYAEEKPKVQYYEGKEGLLAIQEDFLKTKDKKIEEIYSSDDLYGVFTQDELRKSLLMRQQKKIKVRALYTRKGGKFSDIAPLNDMRILPQGQFPIHSDILIYGNKVA
ncbi:helix-turn-helix domain-containing protein, partial [Candidatus Azambacteria bacterium]|nr:helix-turn-helix domain-containing protein [Candidatus Azambacteria bacterium]